MKANCQIKQYFYLLIAIAAIALLFLCFLDKEINKNEIVAFKKYKFQLRNYLFQNETVKTDEEPNTKPQLNITKSKYDKYQYEILKLENGINLLIAHKENVEKLGINIALNGVGSYRDPKDLQGLSHFVEHLLFTGSANYSRIDDILLQSSLKNGQINGMTMPNQTMYPFVFNDLQDIEFCLKRYVDFLKYPLLQKEEVKNELQSVHSEFVNLLAHSTQSILFVLKDLAKKDHPFFGFQCGSEESLSKVGDDPKQIVTQFLEENYLNENTYVTVITDSQLLNQTKAMVQNELLKLEKKETHQFNFNNSDMAFDSENKGKYIKINSLTQITELSIFIPLDVKLSQQTKSFQFITFVFQDLMSINYCSYLLKYHYVSDCDLIVEEITTQEQFLGVYMSLTQKGFDNQFEISRLFFQYFDLIKSKLDKEELKNKVLQEQSYYFENQQPIDVFTYITMLGYSFMFNQNDHLLNDEYDFTKVDKEELNYIINQFNAQNALFILRKNFQDTEEEQAQRYFQTQDKESENQNDLDLVKIMRFLQSGNDSFQNEVKYYNIKYSEYKLNDIEIQSLNKKVTNLEENISINILELSIKDYDESNIQQEIKVIIKQLQSTSHQLILNKQVSPHSIQKKKNKSVFQKLSEQIYKNTQRPQLIKTKKNINLWLYQNHDLYPGLAFASILMSDPSIEQSLVSQFYVELIADYFNLFFDAGLFYPTSKGLSMTVYGYTDNLQRTIFSILESSFDDENFLNEDKYLYLLERHRSYIYRQRENYSVLEIFDWMKDILHAEYLSVETKLDLINSEQISLSDLQNWFKRYKSRFNAELFIGGAVTQHIAEQYLDNFIERIEYNSIPDFEYKPLAYYDVKQKSKTFVYRSNQTYYDENNFSIINYYQIGELNDKKSVKAAQIISQFFNAYSFYYLRSISQLGYNIFSFEYSVGGKMRAITIGIQGHKYAPNEMNHHIEVLIDQVFKEISKLPENVDFNQILDFRGSRSNEIYSLGQAQQSFWELIVNNVLSPEQETKKNKEIHITKREVLVKFKKWFKQQSAKISFQGENKYRKNSDKNQTISQDDTFSFSEEKLYYCPKQLQSELKQKFYLVPVQRKQ
ncbi:insulin-degrading enzyme (macronuclear) [Tetrahymena thermophila SB210]|uniref:Insulin-degrading enzyme n=1 Tax=Tetrahymena thermophila (strain SB210) TaxID=312017 RepID=W7XGQ1_TETTS|nr:insulin-degrading enzyme [Tetrahymena thermophila SB210]EWS76218.1 insulin-degrading enzyme [Tetrahymena thermophila SB210]|eukprot:XP_012651265.1 insulin-degrading enzyme [Tetrahymena thermophila SB210]